MRISDWSSDVCSSDLEAAKAEKNKTNTGGGKTGDEEAKDEKTLESKVIVATRSRFYDDSMARPWSPERRIVLIDLDGKNRIEVMRDRFLLDEPGALQ